MISLAAMTTSHLNFYRHTLLQSECAAAQGWAAPEFSKLAVT